MCVGRLDDGDKLRHRWRAIDGKGRPGMAPKRLNCARWSDWAKGGRGTPILRTRRIGAAGGSAEL